MRVDKLGQRSLRSCNQRRNHYRRGSHWNIGLIMGETNVCRWTKQTPSFFEVASLVIDMRVLLNAKKQTAYERYKKRKNMDRVLPVGPLSFFVSRSYHNKKTTVKSDSCVVKGDSK